jgi:hypothetical protein
MDGVTFDESPASTPTEEVENTVTDTENLETPAEESNKPNLDNRVPQARVNQITARYKSQISELQKENDALKAQKQIDTQPKLADFDHDEEAFNLAKREHDNKKLVEKMFAEHQAEQARQAKLNSRQTKINDFDTRLTAYAAANPNIDQVVNQNPHIQFNDTVTEAILAIKGKDNQGNDLACKMYHYLYANPQKAVDLNTMSATEVGIEFGKLSTKLTGPERKKTTDAPNPGKPLETGSGKATVKLENINNQTDFKKMFGYG